MENQTNTQAAETQATPVTKTVEETATTTQTAETPKSKTFSQEELDRIVSERVKRATEKKAAEIQEAQKLAQMSESERAVAELKTAKEKLLQYENDKLVTQFKLELSTKALPPEFAEIIPVADAEKANAAVKFLSTYKETLIAEKQKEIDVLKEQLKNAEIRGVVPKAVSGSTAGKHSLPGTIF